jgi:hypothetical protein
VCVEELDDAVHGGVLVRHWHAIEGRLYG